MRDHSDCHPSFVWQSQAWYWSTSKEYRDSDIFDAITIGMFHKEGGTSGEFTVTWRELGGTVVPRLEAHVDSWDALYHLNGRFGLVRQLAIWDDEDSSGCRGPYITPSQFVTWLSASGFKDITPRKDPNEKPDEPLVHYTIKLRAESEHDRLQDLRREHQAVSRKADELVKELKVQALKLDAMSRKLKPKKRFDRLKG